jgi:hypothetical protein
MPVRCRQALPLQMLQIVRVLTPSSSATCLAEAEPRSCMVRRTSSAVSLAKAWPVPRKDGLERVARNFSDYFEVVEPDVALVAVARSYRLAGLPAE